MNRRMRNRTYGGVGGATGVTRSPTRFLPEVPAGAKYLVGGVRYHFATSFASVLQRISLSNLHKIWLLFS